MTKKSKKPAAKKTKKPKLQLESLVPAGVTVPSDVSALRLNVFSGRRQPLASGTEFTLNIFDGNQKQVHSKRYTSAPVVVPLKFHDNLGDRHAVSISAKDCVTVGQAPVVTKGGRVTDLSLMLVSSDAAYNFHDARWSALNQSPLYSRLLSSTTEKRYTDLIEDPNRQPALACLFNLVTAMQQVQLVHGTAADLLTEVVWDEENMRQDRTFLWADKELELQIRRASEEGGEFEPDAGGGVLHPGSTGSFRQQAFDGSNLQVTFHGGDKHPKNSDWVRVELDIDYFRDPLPHLLFEVFVNRVTGSRTDPRNVYVMRWAKGLSVGLPNFNPPYYLV